VRVGAQLYTIRDAFAEDCSAALARLREIGYEHVELAGFGGHSVDEVRRALAAASVSAISMHVPLDRLASETDTVVGEAGMLGVGHVVVPGLDERYRRDGLDGYRRAAGELADLADRLGREHLSLHYHNHDVELADAGGQTALEVLLESSGPALGLQLDLGWIRVADADPSSWLRRAVGRVTLAHLKDVTAGGDQPPRFRSVGDGVIDWSEVLETAAEVGVSWGIVEDDDAPDPFASLARSRQHLQVLGVAA
jgi:sugar phosphate isomerase/epimerase